MNDFQFKETFWGWKLVHPVLTEAGHMGFEFGIYKTRYIDAETEEYSWCRLNFDNFDDAKLWLLMHAEARLDQLTKE